MLRMPTMSQIRLAVDGNTKSGVVVAQISRSTSFGLVLVFSRRPRTASAPMWEVPSPFALEDVAFLDAGALGDPRIRRVHQLGELRIGQHIGRHIALNGGDRRTNGLCPAAPPCRHAGYSRHARMPRCG